MLTRRERWGLSRRAWLAGLTVILVLATAFVLGGYQFLAVTRRVEADVLVVEGWVHQYAIQAGAQEFRTGSYEKVFTTGGPVAGTGGYINDFQTAASVGADRLLQAGVSNAVLQMVPSRVMDRDRTYSSAVALREWFHAHQLQVRSINILTEDLHARRTRLLFQKALGSEVAVGIISVPNPDYDAKHWWRYSAGVKEILGETIAYLYTRFFFHPPKPGSSPAPPEGRVP